MLTRDSTTERQPGRRSSLRSPATDCAWVLAARSAVTPHDGEFRRVSAPEGAAVSTREHARLRGWLYRDVHARPAGETVAHQTYQRLPIGPELRLATVRTDGWLAHGDSLRHPRHDVHLVRGGPDGFDMESGGVVRLPRLRCGTAPGWLTVCGMAGAVDASAWRLYLPGVRTEHVEGLVAALDEGWQVRRWSLKSSVALDRDGEAVSRADRTVLYLDDLTDGLPGLLRLLVDVVRPAEGPGFSIQLAPGIMLGGKGTEDGSHGSRMAGLAATGLLTADHTALRRERDALVQCAVAAGVRTVEAS